jgi:hypothetical protein
MINYVMNDNIYYYNLFKVVYNCKESYNNICLKFYKKNDNQHHNDENMLT